MPWLTPSTGVQSLLMKKPTPTMRAEIKRQSRLPLSLLVAAVVGMAGVITMISTSHGRALTQLDTRMTMAILSVSVPMLLIAVVLANRVKCPKCHAMLGFKSRVQSCPSCRVSFDEPMPSKPTL